MEFLRRKRAKCFPLLRKKNWPKFFSQKTSTFCFLCSVVLFLNESTKNGEGPKNSEFVKIFEIPAHDESMIGPKSDYSKQLRSSKRCKYWKDNTKNFYQKFWLVGTKIGGHINLGKRKSTSLPFSNNSVSKIENCETEVFIPSNVFWNCQKSKG